MLEHLMHDHISVRVSGTSWKAVSNIFDGFINPFCPTWPLFYYKLPVSSDPIDECFVFEGALQSRNTLTESVNKHTVVLALRLCDFVMIAVIT